MEKKSFCGLENLITSKLSKDTELVCVKSECELRQFAHRIIITPFRL